MAAVMLLIGQIHFVLGIFAGAAIYLVGIMRILAPDDWDLLYRLTAAMPFGNLIRRFWRRDIVIRD
jgi:hypothetical protein